MKRQSTVIKMGNDKIEVVYSEFVNKAHVNAMIHELINRVFFEGYTSLDINIYETYAEVPEDE